MIVLSYSLGLTPVPLPVLVWSQLGILLCNVLIYFIIRTGFNKSFIDPSLTLLQIVVAVFWTMEVLYYADITRGAVLLLFLVIFVFGLFRLNIRQFLFLSFYTVTGYAAIILLLYKNHPESINVKAEILNLAVLAVVLPWFSLVGGYITRLKTRISNAYYAIKETELKFSTIFNSASDGIVLVDIRDGRFVDANEKVCGMLGYSREECLRLTVPEILPREKASSAMDQFKKIIKNNMVIAEDIPLARKDKTVFFADISGSKITLDKKEYSIGMIRDITERKQAEALLRQSEGKYRLLADHMKDQVWIMDLGLNATYVSPSTEKLLGFTYEEIRRMPLDQLLSPVSFKNAVEFYALEMPKAQAHSDYVLTRTLELEFICKDGHNIWLECVFSSIRDDNGILRAILGEGRDITERRKAEKLLEDSEKRYRLLADNVTDIIFTMNMNLQYTYLSPSAYSISGYNHDELKGISVRDMVDPETFSHFGDILAEELEREKREQSNLSRSRVLEYQHIRKDGVKIWVEATLSFLRDENNSPVGLIGIAREITQRRQIEEKLQTEQQRFRALIEHASDIIVVVNLEGIITYINPAVERVLGFKVEERIGHRGLELIHPDDIKFIAESFVALVENPTPRMIKGEMRLRHKDGGYRTFEGVGSNLINRNVVEAVIVNYRDITERKQAEEILIQSEKRYLELSIIDDLTRLYNSRHFYDQLKKEIERSNRYGHPLTLMLLDLDKFKSFNDTYGHVEGDIVLSRLGQVIKECLRETDSAYRYGGEEFTIILPMTTSEEGMVTAQRIQSELKKESFSPVVSQKIYMTVSIGLAQYKIKEEMRAFVHRVDQLMYQAKNSGRDRICFKS